MNFKDIGRVMGFQDLADYSLLKCENLPTQLWKLITGNKHSIRADKNSHIRHPSVRYLHRMLIHAFYPRKQAGNVTEEDMRLLCPAIRPYAPPGTFSKQRHLCFLPPGALRDAHDHIGRLQRWNKADDRTIEKLKDKCKALSKTVKNQAKTSAKFMKKVADVLTRGGIAGCSSADFAFANTSVPQPPPQPTDLGFPLTDR
ncbi:hypothetical protein F2Q69_00040809 [Brassica cretica]|uniref:Arabidopsis retrotransposon Orf1 C-terminal domain-containing protein n=1 Tax=Brassica cretica TaxID=69181 RepID=A0A8S9NFW1_BRACR|nr:hypothetical protein F2Q69_00040809 [Brassica cretica]